MKSIITKFINLIIFPYKRIVTLHQRILTVKESDLLKTVDRNPYQMLSDWLIDVVSTGFICTITYTAFSSWNGIPPFILTMFGFGLLPSIVKRFKEALMG